MKKRQMTQIGTSFLFYENYFSLELNEQKADLKIVSNFANLDFNLNRMSIFSNPSLTRSKSFQKNLKNRKKVLAKISDCSKYSKPKNKYKKTRAALLLISISRLEKNLHLHSILCKIFPFS